MCSIWSTLQLFGCLFFFFFNDTATTEIYTLSLHDALPISPGPSAPASPASPACSASSLSPGPWGRSEEHTSELQSRRDLVCRLLLEKKKHIEGDAMLAINKKNEEQSDY